MRLQGAEGLAGVGAAGERADLDARVAEQEAQHFAAGVPAGSGDRYPLRRHVHDYTDDCNCICNRIPGVRSPAPRTLASAPMTRLTHDAYLDHVRRESERFRSVLADCDLDARVPSCPDWNAGDLLWHLGAQVQLFWAGVIERRPEGPEWWTEPERPDSPAGWFDTFDDATARPHCGPRVRRSRPEHAWTWSHRPDGRLHRRVARPTRH